jgi:PRC-barrel domain
MYRFRVSLSPAVILTTAVLSLWIDHAVGQEIALTPMEATEVAKGYRADALKLKPVVNEKNESIGRINDFIFGKDGNIYVVLAVGDFTGLSGHLVAVPFPSLKLDDPSGNIVLPGASRTALEKLPVFLSNR